MPRKFTIAVLGFIVLLAVVLRAWQAGESLWLDELHTSWTVGGSLGEVLPRASIGNQSPLYFWLAWFFARLPLTGEVALRLPSMLAGCTLPVAVFWLTRKLLPREEEADETEALLAAALVAIDPRAIFYSQEARPYALLMLVAVFHLGFLLNFLARSTRQSRVLWALTAGLLVHLHYTGGILLLAETVALVALIVTELRARNSLQAGSPSKTLDALTTAWIEISALAVLLLPAIPGMLAIAARRENWNHFVQQQPWQAVLQMFPWTPAAIGLIVLNTWRPIVKHVHLVIVTFGILIPLIGAWLTTEFDIVRLFHQRYLIAVLPLTWIAAALCIRWGMNPAMQSILVGVVLAVATANSGMLQNWRAERKILNDRKEDWRGAIAALNESLKSDPQQRGPVLVRSGLIEADALRDNNEPFFREYCLCPVKGIYRLEASGVFPLPTDEPGLLTAELRERLRSEETIWLLVRTPLASVRRQLLQDLQKSLQTEIDAAEPQFFGNLYLQRIQLRQLPR